MEGDLGSQDLIERIVAEWKKPLGLSDWRIEVKYGGVDSTTVAMVTHCPGACAGVVRVQENWNKHPDQYGYSLEEIILHELLHFVIADKFENDDAVGDWVCDRFSAVLCNAKREGERVGRGLAHRDMAGIIQVEDEI